MVAVEKLVFVDVGWWMVSLIVVTWLPEASFISQERWPTSVS